MIEFITHIKQQIKSGQGPKSKRFITLYKKLLLADIPLPLTLYRGLYVLHLAAANTLQGLMRILYWTPLFKTRLQNHPKQLYLYCGMPLILGALEITIGNNCRINGVTTFCGRASRTHRAQLQIGDNVDISWQSTIAVGTEIVIENNVRMAANVFLAGYPGHPLDPTARAQGLSDTVDQIGKIHLQQDVWLGSNVTVLAGVTIGRGCVIATGSVVTKDIRAGVLAAGNPARVIRQLDTSASTEQGEQYEN